MQIRRRLQRGASLRILSGTILLALLAALALTSSARADQAESQTRSAQQGLVAAGDQHTCVVTTDGNVRCWGDGVAGRLGYGNLAVIGDTERPDSATSVFLGSDRTATATTAGNSHTCALLDDGSVRCWGLGTSGRLGYGDALTIGDTETPGSVAPVNLGAGRTATAITAGNSHTCALLDDGSVRCWGLGTSGRLGYGNTLSIGDDETPGSVAPVYLGAGRTATAVKAGNSHTCALLDDGSVRCWGLGTSGRLGYGNALSIGDDETPGSVVPVFLGTGRSARAISAGGSHSCALLDDGSVLCWGDGTAGRLGYSSVANVGDDEFPGSVPPVALGSGRSAVSVSAGGSHTCAVLDNGSIRCWGDGANGRLGLGDAANIGDNEHPSAVAAVNVGAGRTARAVSAGFAHTCAGLDDGSLQCWGLGTFGRLGYGNTTSIGDDEAPGTIAPVVVGGRVGVAVGDLSLTLEPSTASAGVGDSVLIRTTVTNSGPDALAGVAVRLRTPSPTRLAGASASAGTYDSDTALWTIGSMPSAATVTLLLTVDALAPGHVRAVAEVATSSGFDPDSTPGDSAVEDDRAVAGFEIVAATAPGASPPPADAPVAPPTQLVERGTAGRDILRGSARRDALLGLGDDDRLFGAAGADTLKGGAGSDRIWGAAGDDIAEGGAGGDVLSGGVGRDRLYGGRGDDLLIGGRDDDVLAGGAGSDTLRGGRGSDLLDTADGVRDLVACGPGWDGAVVDALDVVRGCEVVARQRRGPAALALAR